MKQQNTCRISWTATTLALLLLLPSSWSLVAMADETPAGSTAQTKQAAQAIPEWLKDYASDGKDGSNGGGSSGSSSPTTSSAKDSATGITTTADSEPPPPITPAVPPKPVAKPSTTPTPAAAPKKPLVLQGRLEEVGGSGARLPVGILNMGLQAQTPKMDPKGMKKPLQAGLVASFPIDWRGQWSGPLKIHWTQIDKIAWEFDPEETAEIQKILTPGIEGTVTFDFQQQGRNITLEPAQIIFPPRQNETAQRQLQQEMKDSPFAGMFGGQAGGLLSALTTGMPVLILGGMNGRGVTGNQLVSQVLKNDIRELKPGVLEQNIVVRETDKNQHTGKTQHTFSETVLRFTKLNQNQLYVQAASIKYRNDGHFESKVLLYGTVNRGQGSQYPGLPGFPGMMPGMPSGSDGGFGDLNKMLKQLQGM